MRIGGMNAFFSNLSQLTQASKSNRGGALLAGSSALGDRFDFSDLAQRLGNAFTKTSGLSQDQETAIAESAHGEISALRSAAQIAESALQRMHELSTLAEQEHLSKEDRLELQKELVRQQKYFYDAVQSISFGAEGGDESLSFQTWASELATAFIENEQNRIRGNATSPIQDNGDGTSTLTVLGFALPMADEKNFVFHAGAPFEEDPARFASLDVDLGAKLRVGDGKTAMNGGEPDTQKFDAVAFTDSPILKFDGVLSDLGESLEGIFVPSSIEEELQLVDTTPLLFESKGGLTKVTGKTEAVKAYYKKLDKVTFKDYIENTTMDLMSSKNAEKATERIERELEKLDKTYGKAADAYTAFLEAEAADEYSTDEEKDAALLAILSDFGRGLKQMYKNLSIGAVSSFLKNGSAVMD